MTPEDLTIRNDVVEMFINSRDKSVELTTEHFGTQYVSVLPRLSKAKLVSISKQPPLNPKFSDWKDLKKYWKNMYGYRLVDGDEEPLVYYNVKFGSSPGSAGI